MIHLRYVSLYWIKISYRNGYACFRTRVAGEVSKKKKKKKHKQLEGTYISNPEKKALSSSSVVA